MLLQSYNKGIFRPKSKAGFQSLRYIAHLDQDIGIVSHWIRRTKGVSANTWVVSSWKHKFLVADTTG